MTAAPETIPELTETWLPIPGFLDYEVSNLGRVKSKAREVIHKNGRRHMVLECILSSRTNPQTGYLQVCLARSKIHHTKTIQRLVALAFIPNPENKPLVDHIDHNKLNNVVSNLRWATHAENARHRAKANNTGHANICHQVKNNREFYRLAAMRDGVTIVRTYRTLADALAGRLELFGF